MGGGGRLGWQRTTGDKTISVYIFEAATGRLVTRLGRLGNVIYHLAFSPDGSRLAATLYGGKGMRLWETGAGGCSPRTRTMAAKTATARPSMARPAVHRGR